MDGRRGSVGGSKESAQAVVNLDRKEKHRYLGRITLRLKREILDGRSAYYLVRVCWPKPSDAIGAGLLCHAGIRMRAEALQA